LAASALAKNKGGEGGKKKYRRGWGKNVMRVTRGIRKKRELGSVLFSSRYSYDGERIGEERRKRL